MLDIIIPTYNDPSGLRRTLQSLLQEPWITITVINDASTEDYSWIKNEYIFVQYIELKKNIGPGAARNFARSLTTEPYIMFLDCGDILYSKYLLYEIRDTLILKPNLHLYGWSWIDTEDGKLRSETDPSTPGKIYSRAFLEDHYLWQCEGLGSYAGEDMSLNRAIQAIMEDTNDELYYYSPIPIYAVIPNSNSLTHKDNFAFRYKQTPGFIENIIHCMKLLQMNSISMDNQLPIIANMMVILYYQFLYGIGADKEFVASYWEKMRTFYFDYCQLYLNNPKYKEQLSLSSHAHMKGLMYINPIARNPNIHRFLQEIANNETIPSIYMEDNT